MKHRPSWASSHRRSSQGSFVSTPEVSPEIRLRPRLRAAVLFTIGIGGAVAILVASLLIVQSVRMRSLAAEGAGGVPTCSSRTWPPMVISCQMAYRLGSQAGAGVDRAQIWLTTLGEARRQMDWLKQVTEPSGTTAVWVVLYQGKWTCCSNAYDEDGSLIPVSVMDQWLVIADATAESAGFISIGDWTGRAAPESLPEWSPG